MLGLTDADLFAEGREILAEDVTEADFTSYVNAANHAISPLDLEIRSTLHQTTRQRVHALVNTTSDPATQLATAFTPDELGFVKRVMDDMFESNNSRRHEVMAVPTIYALKLHNKTAAGRRVSAHASAAANADGEATQGGGAQPITIMQAERVLQGLVDQGWFEKSRKGFVSLSPRALMELRGWFIETYNEPDDSDGEQASARPQKIKFCYACKEIVTVVRIAGHRLRLNMMADFCCVGPALSYVGLRMPIARWLRAAALPRAKVEEVPALQDRLVWKVSGGGEREAPELYSEAAAKKERSVCCPARQPSCSGENGR